MSRFVHLHLHSQYSLLDGANRLGELLDAVGEAGMPSVALTDHGNMFGAIEFYQKARKKGINPIVGIEAYVTSGSRHDRKEGQAGNNHLVLLAKNETGYRNLLRLSSTAYLEGFYYKPRMDKEILRENSEGIIALSACLKGEVNQSILSGQLKEAEALACEYREIFGKENYFLELQDHGIQAQSRANEVLRRISQQTGIGLIASNDCHYLRKGDAFAHDVLLCIGTGKTVGETDRLRYASDQFYLKDADEMFALFPQDAQAIENTVGIAERCQLEIPTGKFHLPDFPVPDGESLDSYLRKVSREGLEERLVLLRSQGSMRHPESAYWERLDKEIQIIGEMGFPGYFLITWDFIKYARGIDIPVGPGRGSAAGSLVAYALRITDVDPLRYDLLFERFLNPERVSMPDIDIDFCMRRRGEVIQYVSDKYGRDKVAQIITFGTLAAKAAVRDVGRVLGVPYAKVDRIAKMIPDMTRSLAEAAKEIDSLKAEVRNDDEVRQIVEVGSRLEGLTRHSSMHAAGVVITPQPTVELVPLCKTSKGEVLTQWDKDVVEGLGLLKMDFLGLRTLTVIDDAVRSVKQRGVDLDLELIPLDDPEVYLLFREGRTNGIFQFESSGMKELLRGAKPTKFEDLAALNALYRPGALSVGMVEEYVKRKSGRSKVTYLLPQTKPILEETYGIIAYQEQVMNIAVEVAGFSLGEADMLRKAMGKKKIEVMAEQKEKFVNGADSRGVPKAKAAALWEYIEPFAGYGFNKSHSVAYAMLAYKTAWLKTHYPVAFMAAMLSSEMSTSDNVAKYFQECRDMGIAVLPPDINESGWYFTAVEGAVRFGLGAIKGIGEGAVEAILETRRSLGRFKGLTHLACEVDLKQVNRKVFDCLVKSGSFDSIEDNRRCLSEVLEGILDYAQRRRRDQEAGQSSLFGGEASLEPGPDPSVEPWPEQEKLRYEKETLGFYLTGNPLSEYADELAKLVTHTTATLSEDLVGQKVKMGGLISSLRQTKIKTGANAGKFMGHFMLDDLEGSVKVTLFFRALQKFSPLLGEEAKVIVSGTLRQRGSELELTAEEMVSLDDASGRNDFSLILDLAPGTPAARMLELRDVLLEHPGRVPVSFEIRIDGRRVAIAAPDALQVRFDEDLESLVSGILGPGRLRRHSLAPRTAAAGP